MMVTAALYAQGPTEMVIVPRSTAGAMVDAAPSSVRRVLDDAWRGRLGTSYSPEMTDVVGSAAVVAREQLAEALPRRWTHVQAVAAKARRITPAVQPPDADTLVAAAWLHDIGYAPGIADTGLHALDGARWLKQQGWPERLCSLVAFHSCATFEAEERGLAAELLAEFVPEESPVTDALWHADMTTGPDGQDFEVLDRLSEVRSRYGPDHLVTRFWARAEPTLVAAVRRTEHRLSGQPM